MKGYVVENVASGVVFGVYRAEDPDAAIRAMLEDARAPDGTTPSPDLIATEIPDAAQEAQSDHRRDVTRWTHTKHATADALVLGVGAEASARSRSEPAARPEPCECGYYNKSRHHSRIGGGACRHSPR